MERNNVWLLIFIILFTNTLTSFAGNAFLFELFNDSVEVVKGTLIYFENVAYVKTKHRDGSGREVNNIKREFVHQMISVLDEEAC